MSTCLSAVPQSVSLSVHPTVCRSVCPSVCRSVCPSVCRSVYSSACRSVFVRLSLFVCLCSSVCPSNCPSINLSIRLSVCLCSSVCPFISQPIHFVCLSICPRVLLSACSPALLFRELFSYLFCFPLNFHNFLINKFIFKRERPLSYQASTPKHSGASSQLTQPKSNV